MITNNVISLSGGKDSTAMLHLMIERGESIHSVVFFDTGWEFPEMHDHIDLVEKKTGLQIIRLTHPQGFDYWLYRRQVRTKKDRFDKDGNMTHRKGDIFRIGNGWPSPFRRWCTREKVNCIKRYQKTVEGCVPCIGYASDELHRVKAGQQRYPLIEYGITEADAIDYCRNLGYTWGGLYDIFNRVSCWCCQLQSLEDLRKLRKYRPLMWRELLEMDFKLYHTMSYGFKDYWRAAELERRFALEEKFKGIPSRKILRFMKDKSQLNLLEIQ